MINLSEISTADQILYSLIIVVFITMIIISIILYLKSWNRQLRYVKMEVRRAGNPSELKHWKRELKIVYWSLIPGLTIRRIKKIIRFFLKK